ncbi:type-F conjugative transfer system pilin assembly protein TrbC [Cysteiniphilum sp. QT6929]|uniref:type-F conjugative transfer system pilin assembly protein TrbC n=1 Tax=Cysteiniphilum sp. QT6929 TaxID=2975055 RepID=UPI0024B324C0|nr:type-F conjugative transfer system pilin assembly protein TrbC [Cysteiniphilum sp. QT6929]WHN66738.1 type-F conjugative transfer system pilin assembly protein TrbC [Cysteiniphilum sp. QT6929]
MFLCHFKLYNVFKSLSLPLVIQASLVFTFLMLTGVVQANTQRDHYDQQQVESLQAKLTEAAKGYYTQVKSYGKDARIKAQDYQQYARDYAHITLAKISDAQTQMQTYFQNDMDDIRQQLVTASEDFHGVYIFASLAMPIETLRVLNKQAAVLKIPLLIQGLYGDSFESTYVRIEQILFPEGEEKFNPKAPPVGGFAIDPLRFKQFNIKQVPAFVVSKVAQPCIPMSVNNDVINQNKQGKATNQNMPFEYDCPTPDHDVVYGNLSVMDALRILYNKGSESLKTQVLALLEKAQVASRISKINKISKMNQVSKRSKNRLGASDATEETEDKTKE